MYGAMYSTCMVADLSAGLGRGEVGEAQIFPACGAYAHHAIVRIIAANFRGGFIVAEGQLSIDVTVIY